MFAIFSRAPGHPVGYPRVPQGCGSNWGYGDENCLLASPSSSECSLVRQWKFWTSIRDFPGARKGFEGILDWERPGRAIGRAASFWSSRCPTPAIHCQAVASRPGRPKDEARRCSTLPGLPGENRAPGPRGLHVHRNSTPQGFSFRSWATSVRPTGHGQRLVEIVRNPDLTLPNARSPGPVVGVERHQLGPWPALAITISSPAAACSTRRERLSPSVV